MIWQRKGAHRAPALQSYVRRLRTWRRERRSRVAHTPPLVIREPEAGWWEAQAELNEPPAAQPEFPTMTVAILKEREAETDAAVARLAELAVADELLVVFGSTTSAEPGQAVIAGLRGHLPRHHVVAVHVRHRRADMRRYAAALERFLDDGSLPVVFTASAEMHDVAAELSSYVRADRVLRVFRTTTGADLYQLWRRQPEPSVN